MSPVSRRQFLAAGAALLGACRSAPAAPELAAPTACEIGEGPVWHPEAEKLFFLDIPPGKVYAYSPATGRCDLFTEGPTTGAILLHADGRLVLLQDGRISICDLQGRQKEAMKDLSPQGVRFNDGIADPEGRIFTGEIGGEGRVFRIDPDGSVHHLGKGIQIPNGWGFTPDLKRAYFTDSQPRHLYLFDYDRRTGALSNRRLFAEIPLSEGVPDGMCVDSEGFVWTAIWFGARLKRYAPDGRLDREIHFPIRQTSAVCFGGPDLGELFVTTAGTSLADSLKPPGYDVAAAPRGGGLYRLRVPGLRGGPVFRARLRL